MVIWTAHVSKRAKAILAAAALGLAAALAILLFGGGGEHQEAVQMQLATNEERVAYLQSLGWEVQQEPLESLQFLLPETLREPYLSYNELQQSQGFDLQTCCGKQVARYTYAVTNYPGRPEGVQLNLYICEERPVAGDILCAGADGFQGTLVFPEPEA